MSVYLKSFRFPSDNAETDFVWSIKRKCFDSYYPFRVLAPRGLEQLDFEPVTILYGGNGSGKSTALNVMAEKLAPIFNVKRGALFNKSNFFPHFVEMCQAELGTETPAHSRIVTSDDVFDYMLNIRCINAGIDQRREAVFGEYLDAKYADFQLKSIDDYERLKQVNKARSKTQSKYIRSELMDNAPEYSNGESAFKYFTEKMDDNGLYLLDEPENSLSPKRQQELAAFIEESARFFGCQIIMATHSPFLLALRSARIIDLDGQPIAAKRWTELEHVRLYHEFFTARAGEFE